MPCGIGWRHPHHAELLERRPAVDFLEVHSENFFDDGGAALQGLHAARACWEVSLHGVGLALGSAAGLDPWHLERLARLVDRIDPVRVSDHAAFARAPLAAAGGEPVHANDLLPIAFTPACLSIMVRHVEQVQARLRRPLLVENLAAYVAWRDVGMDEAAFFNALAARTGCGLLLDVNNLFVNSLNELDRDGPQAVREAQACTRAMAFVDAVQPGIVGEIHVAGHRDLGDIVIDDHGDHVAAPVWRLCEHALRRFGAGIPVLVEWDTDVPPLDVLLGEADRGRAIGHAAAAGGASAVVAGQA